MASANSKAATDVSGVGTLSKAEDAKRFKAFSWKLHLANALLNHPFLRTLLPTTTMQNLHPARLDRDATSYVYTLEPKDMVPTIDNTPIEFFQQTSDPRHLHALTGTDGLVNFFLEMEIESFNLVVVSDEWSVKHPGLSERFPAHACPMWLDLSDSLKRSKENLILVCITQLTPVDVLSKGKGPAKDETRRNDAVSTDWFPALASVLLNTTVKLALACQEGPASPQLGGAKVLTRRDTFCKIQNSAVSHIPENDYGSPRMKHQTYAIDTTTFKCYAAVNGLTATLLTMKARGNLEAMARVFFFAPSQIAQEIRVFGLAPAVGVQATSYLLACIFDALGKQNYDINQPELLLAATHLLVSHIGRRDYHEWLEKAIPGKKGYVADRLCALIDIQFDGKSMTDFKAYAKMAALRDGVVYGAMRAYAKDLDTHNAAHIAALQGFANAVNTVATTAAGAIPLVGAEADAAVAAGGSLITLAITHWAGAKWNAGELDAALASRFDIEVTGPAKSGPPGVLPMLKKDVAEAQATSESKSIPAWAVVNNDVIQNVYLVNIGYVMTFAMNGSVTPRLSTIRRGYRRVKAMA